MSLTHSRSGELLPLDSPVVISVSDFTKYFKDGIWIITGQEDVPCPICSGKLAVRGTCKRKLRQESDDTITLRLRVMECKGCGKTHRELPEGIVPYKRHDAESICGMQKAPQDCIAEPSVRNRIIVWLAWFLRYGKDVLKSLLEQGYHLTEPVVEPLSRQLVQFVRLVVNSGMWVQHRSVIRFS